jgi:hypothetical protein
MNGAPSESEIIGYKYNPETRTTTVFLTGDRSFKLRKDEIVVEHCTVFFWLVLLVPAVVGLFYIVQAFDSLVDFTFHLARHLLHF